MHSNCILDPHLSRSVISYEGSEPKILSRIAKTTAALNSRLGPEHLTGF